MMGATRSFRFAEDDLNRWLIALLQRSDIKHSVDRKGYIHFSPDDEAMVENDLIGSIRTEIFPSWQVLTCPKEWVGRYKQYMTEHQIPFKEEWTSGDLWFLLPRKYRPHQWKLAEESATAG